MLHGTWYVLEATLEAVKAGKRKSLGVGTYAMHDRSEGTEEEARAHG